MLPFLAKWKEIKGIIHSEINANDQFCIDMCNVIDAWTCSAYRRPGFHPRHYLLPRAPPNPGHRWVWPVKPPKQRPDRFTIYCMCEWLFAGLTLLSIMPSHASSFLFCSCATPSPSGLLTLGPGVISESARDWVCCQGLQREARSLPPVPSLILLDQPQTNTVGGCVGLCLVGRLLHIEWQQRYLSCI